MGNGNTTRPVIQRQTQVLNVDPKIPPLREIPVTTNVEEYEKAREIVDPVTKKGTPRKPVAIFNQSQALAAEVAAKDWVKAAYGSRAKLRGVLKRPGGIPVFDYVFETGPNEFLVVEAKAYYSELGFTNDHVMIQGPRGDMRLVTLPDDVEQFSGKWLEQKVDELAGKDSPSVKASRYADDSSKLLSQELNESWRAGRVRGVVVRAPLNPKSTELVFEVVDYTDELNAHVGATARHEIPRGSEVGSNRAGAPVRKGVSYAARTPAQRSLALNQQLLKEELRTASKKTTELKNNAKAKEGKARTAKKRLDTAERNLKKATGPKAIADARVNATTRKAELASLEREAVEARTAAEEAAKTEGAIGKKIGETRKKIARLETLRTDRPVRPVPGQPRPPATGAPTSAERGTTAVQKARGLHETSVADRGLGRSATASTLSAESAVDTAAKSKGVVKAVGRQVQKLARSERLRAVGRFALKGSKVVMKAGKFIFRIVEVVNPVLDLLMLVDAVDYLVDWLQREKKEEQAEWKRIAHFLSAPGETTRIPPYNMPYTVAFGDTVSRLVQLALAGETSPGNFVNWLHKWDTERAWGGFVYATATVNLERQALQDSDDDPYPVAYYLAGAINVYPTHKPLPNSKQKGPYLLVSESDERNHRTGGRQEAPYADPKYTVVVEIKPLWVRYTYPNPILTPFDFILAKSNSLIAEIVAFISKYDERIVRDMDVRSEIIPGVASHNWLDGFDFQPPLSGPYITRSLSIIYNAIDVLSKPGPEQGDGRMPNPPQRQNAGYHRRLQILRQLVTPPGPRSGSFHQIATDLGHILLPANPRHLVASRDKDLDDLTVQDLQDLAMDIHADIQRAFKACRTPATGLDFNFEGPTSA